MVHFAGEHVVLQRGEGAHAEKAAGFVSTKEESRTRPGRPHRFVDAGHQLAEADALRCDVRANGASKRKVRGATRATGGSTRAEDAGGCAGRGVPKAVLRSYDLSTAFTRVTRGALYGDARTGTRGEELRTQGGLFRFKLWVKLCVRGGRCAERGAGACVRMPAAAQTNSAPARTAVSWRTKGKSVLLILLWRGPCGAAAARWSTRSVKPY